MPLERKVKPGECIASIAAQHGFFPDTIWDDPANSDLKKLREDPNCLEPGDIVVIMDKRQVEVDASTEARHTFRKKGVPEKLVICITSFDGEEEAPKANAKFTLTIDGVARLDLVTDAKGMIDEWIPPGAKYAVAVFSDGEEFEFELGDLDPLGTIAGVHGRLTNLGFDCGPLNSSLTKKLEAAIREFQQSRGLTVNGFFDDEDFSTALGNEYEAKN